MNQLEYEKDVLEAAERCKGNEASLDKATREEQQLGSKVRELKRTLEDLEIEHFDKTTEVGRLFKLRGHFDKALSKAANKKVDC